MTPEQMQKIVDDAPEWADGYSTFEQDYFAGPVEYSDIDFLISDLRTELAKHDTFDLEPADIPHGTIVLEK